MTDDITVLPDTWKPVVPRGDVKAIADDLADAKNALEVARDAATEAQNVYDRYEAELFTALENAGLRSIRTARGLFSLNDLAWASVEDEEAARRWAELHMEELLTLNRQRLSVVVRKALTGDETPPGVEEGHQLPPGVTFRTSRKITWRRT